MGISPATEESWLSAALNSIVLEVFLTGIYALVYFGTVYIYLRRKLEHSFFVVFTITMLFIFIITNMGLQWYLLPWSFVDNGKSRDNIFATFFDVSGRSSWIIFASTICAYSAVVLADILLIWRCFHIWGHSFRVISLPLFFLLAETVTFSLTIFLPLKPNLSLLDTVHITQLTCVALFASFCCTLTTTSLIGYRIYPILKQDHSRSGFKKILDILIQSAAAYALTSLLQAIFIAVVQPSVVVAGLYIDILFTVNAGLAPTLVVTRIALMPDKTEVSTTPHLSVLQFNQGWSTHHITSTINITNIIPEASESSSIHGDTVKKETV